MADWNNTPADLGNALQESTNGATHPGPPRDQEKIKLALDKGWVPQTQYNYEATIAPATEPSATAPAVDTPAQTNLLDSEEIPGWMARARKYEWNEEYGDVGPEIPELERELFGSELRLKKGQHFDKLLSIKVVAEATERPAPVQHFEDAGLHPVMLDNIKKSGYEKPTPIQAYTIPAVLKGRDVIAVAQTGSGKTAAYMAPSLSKLMGKAKKLCAARPYYLKPGYDHRAERVRAEPLILVIAPTRELCIQIFDEARRLCYRTMLRPCVAYGGGPPREQREDLEKGCDILIATPGRLLDFMRDPRLLVLNRLRFTIIDEADEMLHEDWSEELEGILSGADASVDSQHQYLLFSATFDKRMRTLAKKYLDQDYVRIRIGRTGSTVKNIKQQVVWVDKNQKKQALYDLLIASPPARTLIFCRTKKTVDYVDDFLFNQGLPTTSIHSDRTQLEREDAIRAFRKGVAPILIATSVSARGLDIRNVMHVVNFDLPLADYGGQDEYIHRIGRTGRAGNEGLATAFYNEGDEPMAPFLAKILVENGWNVPDFLDEYKPAQDEELDFNDDSGDEENEPLTGAAETNGADDGDAWGGAPTQGAAPVVEETWGTGAAQTNGAGDDWGTGTANTTGGW